MNRNEAIILIGIIIGIVMLVIGLLTHYHKSLVGMMLVGPIMISVSIASLSSYFLEKKVFLLKNSGGCWIKKGDAGYHWAAIVSLILGILGLFLIYICIIKSG